MSNARNAAAGALKLLDPKETVRRKLRFVAYELIAANEGPQTQIEALSTLSAAGFEVPPVVRLCENTSELFAAVGDIEQSRSALPLECDGLVVKINDLALKRALGSTARAPRGAVAFKFGASKSITAVRGVSMQVSRAGVITPVAELEPTMIGGVIVSRATLHNFTELARLDVRIGDDVVVERSGDVIPKIIGVDVSARKGEQMRGPSLQVPNACPACQEPTVTESGGLVRCTNSQCAAQALNRLTYFASKHAMDINHLGKSVAKKLLDAKLVTHFADLYTLSEKSLLSLPGFQARSAKRLLDSIDNSRRSSSLTRVLIALGIPGVGRTSAPNIAAALEHNLERLLQIDESALLKIDNVGEKTARGIVTAVRNPEMLVEIQKLLCIGIGLSGESNSRVREKARGQARSGFAGKVFVFTGALGDDMTRSQAIGLIERAGGSAQGSVTKRTHYLIVGEKGAESKLFKAQKLGLEILNREQFETLLASS
eukprot:CAMPEP_0185831382 /NCGR_PEP_ID=MMETSP1353-20130828/1457_1 /TAXON_ID=1077150 /ORGANISM="Erythrolobus australicus, Strain CCMP3124" /LENGTH=485 /DNA_ID=CAMNT_0028529435 /DNA_START=132 /DNA_END=1589 /DNA_ORIENTATION=+